MKRNAIIALTVLLLLTAVTLSISTTVFAVTGENRPLQQSSLPQITFLGEGPQTFTVEPPREFLVKTYQNGSFLFITVAGPTYTAVRGERVWTTDFVPTEPMRLFHESRNYGNVAAGCVVNYVQIEDNIDTRRNTFYINGKVLQVVDQGMVTYGSFTVPEAGELTFYAEDSIGMVVELCANLQTVVPGGDTTATTTFTAAPTASGTVEIPTFMPTDTLAPSGTPPVVIIPSPTSSITPSATFTTSPGTGTPAVVVVTPAASSPTPTKTGVAILITATPQLTPSAIPLSGGGPGPREIAGISGLIIALFGLVAAAWWLLLRAYSNNGR